jgi:MoaA/NifB/PqqE/SkfB family radical SAM enzyme
MRRKIVFTWDIHLDCNYRCPYCWFHGKWGEVKHQNKYLSADELGRYWQRIYDKYGRVLITVAGGEPLTYPGYQDVFVTLARMHDIEITTNLSLPAGELRNFADRLKEDNVRISGSFHPLFADISEFVEKVKILDSMDMLGGVLFLAWPGQLNKLSEYKEIFTGEDIKMNILTFWGSYEGGKYPDSYSDEEKNMIEMDLGKREGEQFQLAPKITKGKLCNAGHKYAVIHPDGEVFRCGGGGVEAENVPIGNFFDDNFQLLDVPQPCHSRICPCNEWAFLLMEEK